MSNVWLAGGKGIRLFFGIMLAAVCLPMAAAEPLEPVTITVDASQVINPNVTGFGWNVGPLWIPAPQYGDTKDLDRFFELFKDTGQPWIRIMLSYYEWECKINNGANPVYENDDNDPWTKPQQFLSPDFRGFAWNSREGLDWRIRYVLDFCEKNDIWVEINNWETWMKRWLDQKPDEKGIVSYEEYLAKAQEFGENVAAFLYYLKTRANQGKGYACVKYYGLWNEPGGLFPDQDFIHGDYPGYMNLLHKTVYDHLVFYDQEMGTKVLQGLQCMGFESYPTFRNRPKAGHPTETWNDMIGRGVLQYLEKPDGLPGEITNWPGADPYIDIISVHDYWSVFDYDKNNPSGENQGTIQDRLIPLMIQGVMDQIVQYDTDGRIEPLFINEIGGKVYCQGEDHPAQYCHMLYIVECLVRGLERGLKGGSVWAWNMHTGYAAVSYPGCWWEVEPKGVVHPIHENYFPYTLLTRTVKRGSNMIFTEVQGGQDDSRGPETWPVVKTQRVWSTALVTPDNKLAVIVISDSYNTKEMQIQIAPRKGTVEKYFVTSTQCDQLYTNTLDSTDGIIRDQLLPRSITVYQVN